MLSRINWRYLAVVEPQQQGLLEFRKQWRLRPRILASKDEEAKRRLLDALKDQLEIPGSSGAATAGFAGVQEAMAARDRILASKDEEAKRRLLNVLEGSTGDTWQ